MKHAALTLLYIPYSQNFVSVISGFSDIQETIRGEAFVALQLNINQMALQTCEELRNFSGHLKISRSRFEKEHKSLLLKIKLSQRDRILRQSLKVFQCATPQRNISKRKNGNDKDFSPVKSINLSTS